MLFHVIARVASCCCIVLNVTVRSRMLLRVTTHCCMLLHSLASSCTSLHSVELYCVLLHSVVCCCTLSHVFPQHITDHQSPRVKLLYSQQGQRLKSSSQRSY